MAKTGELSYTDKVKQKLVNIYPSENHCAFCELAGMTMYASIFSPELILISSNLPEVIDKFIGLFVRCTEFKHIPFETINENSKYTLQIDGDTANYLFNICLKNGHLNNDIFKCDKCKMSFVRGAFLCAGHVNPPEKNYDIEFKTSNVDVSCDFYLMLSSFLSSTKMTFRNGMQIVYNKCGDNVYFLLNDMGDTVHSFEIVNSQLVKSIRNEQNRQTNFEVSNIQKQKSSAQIHITAIKYLKKNNHLVDLSKQLQETAKLRMKYRDYSISQLAAAETPPVSKSQESKRLSAIVNYYNELTKK